MEDFQISICKCLYIYVMIIRIVTIVCNRSAYIKNRYNGGKNGNLVSLQLYSVAWGCCNGSELFGVSH